jgi:hypothetical protein
MFIACDYPNLASSEGATYSYSYVAPSELAMNIIIKAINIGLLRSRSNLLITIDFNLHSPHLYEGVQIKVDCYQ